MSNYFYTFISEFFVKMTEQLIEKVFDKAGKESGKNSIHGKAEYLAEHILKVYKFSVSSKQLTRYYKKEYAASHPLTDYLSKYLGYENYAAFVNNEREPNFPQDLKKPKKQKTWIITLILVPLLGVSVYVGYQTGKEECMVWKEDHFEKTVCSGSENEEPLQTSRLNNFRKITPTDITTFLKNGEVQVWYDKSDNQLEFFTAPGLHPINKKNLKPVTNYIIEKYIK